MLWDRNKPLNQPPGFGRVGFDTSINPQAQDGESEKAAQRAISNSQLQRDDATRRYGGRRAVVRE